MLDAMYYDVVSVRVRVRVRVRLVHLIRHSLPLEVCCDFAYDP